MEEKYDIRVKRLEQLKQFILLNYLDIIQFDNAKDFYNVLMEKVFQGEFDHSFLSQSLMGVDVEERREIFQLAKKYKSLCFYMGDFSYWADSIGGVYLADLDLVSMKVLDNYDFLLGLAKDGGEHLLELLLSFQDSRMAQEGSVIDFLRNRFVDDDTLRKILFEMSKDDGEYKEFTNSQKRILCTYPNGVLYHVGDDSIEIHSLDEIKNSIEKETLKDDISHLQDSSFENTILNISYHRSGNYNVSEYY